MRDISIISNSVVGLDTSQAFKSLGGESLQGDWSKSDRRGDQILLRKQFSNGIKCR